MTIPLYPCDHPPNGLNSQKLGLSRFLYEMGSFKDELSNPGFQILCYVLVSKGKSDEAQFDSPLRIHRPCTVSYWANCLKSAYKQRQRI